MKRKTFLPVTHKTALHFFSSIFLPQPLTISELHFLLSSFWQEILCAGILQQLCIAYYNEFKLSYIYLKNRQHHKQKSKLQKYHASHLVLVDQWSAFNGRYIRTETSNLTRAMIYLKSAHQISLLNYFWLFFKGSKGKAVAYSNIERGLSNLSVSLPLVIT